MNFTDLLPLIPFFLAVTAVGLVLFLVVDSIFNLWLSRFRFESQIRCLKFRVEQLETKLRELNNELPR